MRVTQGMMTNNVLQNLSNGYGKVADYQNMLSTGKKITRPSQDPVVAVMGIAYRTDVTHVEQYKKNVDTAYKWLDSSDDALSQVSNVLKRIRDLTEQGSNGTYTPAQREAMATEIDELVDHIVTLGNSQSGGTYIFSGRDSANPLLTRNTDGSVDINTNATTAPTDQNFDVNDGISVSVNVDPNKVFTTDLFSDLNNLIGVLKDPNSSTNTISGYLTEIDTHLDEVSSAQADLGAKTNRLDMVSNRLDMQKSIATKIMSTNEDADYAETIINLNQQQNVYNAALSVGAKIIQTSLVDFLK